MIKGELEIEQALKKTEPGQRQEEGGYPQHALKGGSGP